MKVYESKESRRAIAIFVYIYSARTEANIMTKMAFTNLT